MQEKRNLGQMGPERVKIQGAGNQRAYLEGKASNLKKTRERKAG